MNAKSLTLGLSLVLAASSSFAADLAWRATLEDPTPSTLTRGDVRAELARSQTSAQSDGVRIAYAVPAASDAGPGSGLTRAQVRAELARARAAGELDGNIKAYGVRPPIDAVPAPALATATAQHDGSRN